MKEATTWHVSQEGGKRSRSRRMMSHQFVESSENNLGTGKLISTDGEISTIAYFRSPADEEPVRRQVASRSLTPRVLPPETRAYFCNPETDSIEVGRVLHYQKDDELYLVRFPNDQPRMLSSDEFEVRCRLPIAEPMDHLASQSDETAFCRAALSRFVKNLLEQHRTSERLSLLLFPLVESMAEQASVIRCGLMNLFPRLSMVRVENHRNYFEAFTVVLSAVPSRTTIETKRPSLRTTLTSVLTPRLSLHNHQTDCSVGERNQISGPVPCMSIRNHDAQRGC